MTERKLLLVSLMLLGLYFEGLLCCDRDDCFSSCKSQRSDAGACIDNRCSCLKSGIVSEIESVGTSDAAGSTDLNKVQKVLLRGASMQKNEIEQYWCVNFFCNLACKLEGYDSGECFDGKCWCYI